MIRVDSELDQMRQWNPQPVEEEEVERRDGHYADDRGVAPGFTAEELQPDHREHQRRNLEAHQRHQEPERDEGDDTDDRQQATAGERLAVGQSAAGDEQHRRQPRDEDADGERPQPRTGLGERPEAVAPCEARAGDADRDPDHRTDHLIEGAARRWALLLHFVGDLSFELGEDVGRMRMRRRLDGVGALLLDVVHGSCQPSLRRLMPYCATRSA